MAEVLKRTSITPQKANIIVIVVLHVVGIFGLQSPFADTFVYLTPLHLLITAALLYRANEDKSNPFVFFTTLTLMLTFAVEMIGVNTGMIFGGYTYGEVLGPQLYGTPVIIGVNWFLLACSAGALIDHITIPKPAKVILSAAALTAIDYIIEPVAIFLGFWEWDAVAVPLKNYAGWFGTGVVVMALYYYLPFKRQNYLAKWVLGAQIAFFVCLNLYIIFNG